MPIYHSMGEIPRKRHVVARQEDGSLYAEQLVGSHGFSGPSSLLYHLRRPTSVVRVAPLRSLDWAREDAPFVHPRHFRTSRLQDGGSPVLDRVPLLFNADVAISFTSADHEDDFFYRNGQGDELLYVSEGEGVLESWMGELSFGPGDYLVIPRGILHRHRISKGPLRCLVIESAGQVRVPARYRNELGQLTEASPFSERDIRRPERLPVHDERGEFRTVVKRDHQLVEVVIDHHPLDVAGWDGYYYPWAFQIRDFEPRVGRLHLPPPFHQTFEGQGFVVCSFVPRPYDFDPAAVPAPYHHSNVMSEEVIFYASTEFMSRKGIEYGSLTLHPDGLPHGPHPGMTEASIGKPGTEEVAVMVDTFRPLRVSRQAVAIEDAAYATSWAGDGP